MLENSFEISEDSVVPCVQKRIDLLQSSISFLERQLERSPQGSLCASCSHGKIQWQFYNRGVKRYLPKSNIVQIKRLAQKKYFAMMLGSLQKQRDSLDRLIQDYHPELAQELFSSLSREWQSVTTPLFPSAEEFVSTWESVRYRGKSMEGACLQANCGIKVRSKSEMIIADALASARVPFRYEYPCWLNWGGEGGVERRVKVYPDFTCLNVRTRREYVWEHFGMMDDSNYSQEAIGKLEAFENSGFVFGENFMYTMETRKNPLNSQKVQKLIERYLL